MSSYLCSDHPEQASSDFAKVREKKANGGKATRLAYHVMMSFSGRETGPENAMQLADELCRRFLKGEYQYVMAVHTDTDNVHCHIIFNSVNARNGKSFSTLEDRKASPAWKRLQKTSDEICKEHRLSVIQQSPERSKGKSRYEWEMDSRGASWKTKLKWEIDECAAKGGTWEEFLENLRERDIEVVYDPSKVVDLKFRLKGQQRFARARTLGWQYESGQLRQRLAMAADKEYIPQRTASPGTFLDSSGKNRWEEILAMKDSDRVINTLREVGARSQRELETAALSRHAEQIGTVMRLRQIIGEIDTLSEHVTLFGVLRKYRPFYDAWKAKSGRAQKTYAEKYEPQLARFRDAARELKAAYGSRVPSEKELEQRRSELLSERSVKNEAYNQQKARLKEIDFTRRALEDLLRDTPSRDKDKSRESLE